MDGFDHVEPVDIRVKTLSVFQSGGWNRKPKRESPSILRNVNFHVPPGQLLAIMGGSGSGKTTLLNALAGRVNGAQTAGTVSMNGDPAKAYIATGRVAYVQQNDQLLPYLTVRETLRYAARLRLPNDMSREDKYKLVENVILELGLKECADTIIGDDRRKGCSGGEKRRVSVGVQLLLNPSVIFMDEPTTGLDAFTSLSLVETLVSLCRKGRTICVSIHQPRSDIFELFDYIVLLTRGDLVYSGRRADVLDHFAKQSHEIPAQMNPADFLIDVSSVDNSDLGAEESSTLRIKLLVEYWEKENGRNIPPERPERNESLTSVVENTPGSGQQSTENLSSRRIGASPWSQTLILADRTFRNLLQDRLTLWGSVLEVLILATAVGLIFYKLDETESGILGRKSLLYITASVQNYLGLMFMVFKLSMEMKVFDRERLDKMYGVVPYLLGWLIANFLLYTLLSCLFAVIIYYMTALRTDEVYHLGVFALANVLMQFVTIGWAYFCISWARDFATASLIANSFFTFLSTSSGFFIQVDEIPVYLRWFKHISYITYGYNLLATNEFSDNNYECCDGAAILRSLAFEEDDYLYPALALVVNFVALMILAGLVLQFKPAAGLRHASAVKEKKKKGTNTLDEEAQRNELDPLPRIDISLERVSLYLTKQTPTSKAKRSAVTILDSVSADFKAGELSIILGSSGAGKSTLLSVLMARGLKPGPFTKVSQSGSVLYKGVEITDPAQVASLCSFVSQDDVHLLPGLSARETLRYSGLLRLPADMPHDEKIRRADKVLLELGLKDCADRLVGGEGVMGLSGGQKRRLSIGVQMLTNPAVLIIDEPTSGLDSYTSYNLVLKLKEIAASGRTIICSIHQPRSDIVTLFDRVLLLARGGRTVYSGTGKGMLPYFATLDHTIPRLTNPADFALDLSSIDLRNALAERASRDRVVKLIQAWTEKNIATQPRDSVVSDPQTVKTSEINLTALGCRTRAPFTTSTNVLIKRSMVNMMRQPNLAMARIMQVVALAVIFALYFARLGLNQPSVQSRFGLLQQQGSLIFVGMLNCIAVFPQELHLMRIEFRDNVYSVWAFFVSYCVNEFPFEIASSLLYTVVTMFAIGLQSSVTNFFQLAFVAFCLINTGESLGIAFCAMVDSVGFSVQIMSTVMSLQVCMSGFLSVKMPSFMEGINYIFLTRYIARILAVQEFNDLSFSCSAADVALGTCSFQNGTDALQLLDFDSSRSAWQFNMAMVAALTIIFRGAAYVILWSRTKN
ncbi:hypothetical protein PhCBS80983_g02858 [Powellomyces hirtus]|uniref:ABC transporter domain-containing protein n=1 Tax=Powellomyces hirtus TaxID=109895 RepID=A0A507E4U8_9FUNG|nr:hypothetical protein PhCBS80983_g02858 [Powellomyces hirtus]